MIKANSPICEKLKPDCIEILSDWPEASIPTVPKNTCPTITTSDSRQMGRAYWLKASGLTSMPTDTKKMAPKRSLTGPTTLPMRSASLVPARIEPMTKAPRADEKPT